MSELAIGIAHVQLAIPRGGEAVGRAFWGEVLGTRRFHADDPLGNRLEFIAL